MLNFIEIWTVYSKLWKELHTVTMVQSILCKNEQCLGSWAYTALGKDVLFLGCSWLGWLCSVIIMCMCQANSCTCNWCLPWPTPNMFNMGVIIRWPTICQMMNYQKITVLYSWKYGIWEISYSRILPDKLLVAQMTQEIPWHFCNLTSYYKTENGWFMKDETSDIEYLKTHKLYHIVSQHCRICL